MDIGLLLDLAMNEINDAGATRKRSFSSMQDEAVEAHEAKRKRGDNDALCESCQMVNFDAISNKGWQKKQSLCTLKQMTQNDQCPLCRLIITTLRGEEKQRFPKYIWSQPTRSAIRRPSIQSRRTKL